VPDAAPVADAVPPDAALPVDLAYVIDTVRVPESPNEATALGLDLDGNMQPDNALGALLAALHGQAGLPIGDAQMEAIGSGRALTLFKLDGVLLPDTADLPVLISPGADLDDDPGDNFSGSEMFALAPLDGADGQLVGSMSDGHLRAGPGAVPVLLAAAGDPAEVTALRGVGGRVECDASAAALASGRFGAAFSPEEIHTRLIPPLADGIDAIVQRDCPDNLCEPDTPGESLKAFFDDDGDGRITAFELESNSLISSTLGNPDLDLFDENGDFNPRVDGVKDSLSFAVGFTAVGAVVAE